MLMKMIYILNKKKERFETLSKYCSVVSNLVDNAANNLEGQLSNKYYSKGANLMMNVLSENIMN
jgi:hypothetical protein